jgi:hypothetical protein
MKITVPAGELMSLVRHTVPPVATSMDDVIRAHCFGHLYKTRKRRPLQSLITGGAIRCYQVAKILPHHHSLPPLWSIPLYLTLSHSAFDVPKMKHLSPSRLGRLWLKSKLRGR